MTPQEIFSKQNDLAQGTSTALNSLKEYLVSVRQKLMGWTALADTSNQAITVAVTTKADENIKKMVTITRAEYQQCVDDIDGEDIMLPISENATEAFSRTEIMSAIEDVMSESGVQYEFIDYVMNNESVNIATFSTYMKTKFDALSNQLLEKYTQYLSSGDPISALTNYFSSLNLANATKGSNDEYITIAAKSAFTGTSVWSIIWTDFTNKINDLFQGVWQGLTHLKEFFKNLFNKIIELGKWLLSKIAKPLTTNYEKSGSNFGILDLPLLQFKLGHLNISTRGNNSITESSDMTIIRDMSHLYCRKTQDLTTMGYAAILNEHKTQKYYLSPDGNSDYANNATVKLTRMIKHFAECLVDYDDDGESLIRPFDVVIPISDFITRDYYSQNWMNAIPDSIILRLGVDEYLDVYIQMFVSLPKSIYDTFYDAEIAKALMNAPSYLVDLASQTLPCMFSTGHDSYLYNGVLYTGGNYAMWNGVVNFLFSDLSPEESSSTGPIDLVSHLKGFNYEDCLDDTSTFADPEDSTWTCSMAAARFMGCVLIPLIFLNAPHLELTCNDAGDVNTVLSLVGDSTTYGGKYHWAAIPPASTNDMLVPSNWLTVYRPYCNSALISPSIHYQTLKERAGEIEKYIIGAVVAIAAVIVTIKMAKFIKNRKMKFELADGYAQNMAWNLPENPSSAQVAEYAKARKKARTIGRHNALLGISTNYAANAAVASTVDALSNQLLATQGYQDDQTTNAPTIREIKTLITGH